MIDHASQIKSMKLYSNIDRVLNELKELGKGDQASLTALEISEFDQMHYHGTKAVDHAIKIMKLKETSKVLEIGSGFGGPARHIAEQTKAHVTAIELQSDLNELAIELTTRCGLLDRVNHIEGDALSYPWNGEKFDNIVSWLAILHIPDRARLFEVSESVLKQGGLFFVEDVYARNPLEEWEIAEIQSGMYTPYLPDLQTYQQDFIDAGFEIVHCEDVSDDWSAYTTQRLKDYRATKDRHVRVHNLATYEAMEEFYDLVGRHFLSGKLGGIKILARKL